jgi:putative FmdB family regulatory protein
MPTYEYRCQNGHEFEVFQRMSEPPVDKCPQCGAASERKLSAGAGVLFKGSGFYITENRSDSYKKAAEADKGGGGGEKSADTGTKKADSGKSSTGSE